MIDRHPRHGLQALAVTIDSTTWPVDGNESLDETVRDSTGISSAPGETETMNATRGSLAFDDQVVADSNRQEVVINSVTSTEGGFVAIYNTTAGGSLDSVIGASTYLAAGLSNTPVSRPTRSVASGSGPPRGVASVI